MRLPRLAIENHQFTIVLVIMLVLLGIVSLFTMPYSEDPPVSKAGASVLMVYPGANPKDLEQLAVDPVEEALNELDDINVISSHMRDGFAVVAVEFLVGSDPEDKQHKQRSIRRYHKLEPDEVGSGGHQHPPDCHRFRLSKLR